MSSTDVDKFDRCVELWRHAKDNRFQEGRFLFLPGSDVDEINDPVSREGDDWFELLPPVTQEAIFSESLDTLIRKVHVRTRLPKKFYLAKPDILVVDGQADNTSKQHEIETYLLATEIVQFLKGVADHEYRDSNQDLYLVFLGKEKLVIPVHYEPDDLESLRNKEKVLSEWRTHLLERGHNQQKRTILKQLLLEEFGSLDENARLAALFHRIGNLYKRYLSRYETYVAEVSVEKVLEKLEKDKLEWLGKINKAVTDLNAQILGVPLATLLAGARLVGNPDDALANMIVVVAIVIFVFLLLQSIRMQKHHVEVLNQTLGSEREILERRHMAMKDEIEKVFDALEKQVNATRRRLASYRFLGWLLFLLTAGYYLVTISPELKDFLLQFYRTGPR